MAQDAMDAAVKTGKLPQAGPCRTAHAQLLGSAGQGQTQKCISTLL